MTIYKPNSLTGNKDQTINKTKSWRQTPYFHKINSIYKFFEEFRRKMYRSGRKANSMSNITVQFSNKLLILKCHKSNNTQYKTPQVSTIAPERS